MKIIFLIKFVKFTTYAIQYMNVFSVCLEIVYYNFLLKFFTKKVLNYIYILKKWEKVRKIEVKKKTVYKS